MKKMFYPAVFIPEDDGGFTVTFPDVPSCITCGDSMEQSYEMAFEALGLVLSYMVDKKEPIPRASNPQDIKLEDGQFLVVIEFDMVAYKKRTESRAIKKTLTIPSWLNDAALEKNINFSQVLQDALREKLHIV
ncbi:type II toxin-antitoxin system HicB family antitoxin [Acetobacterium wieringae]|uniref:Type II toxin-antitoxin system HicB family antitoxin n=1 Tax=Acetobacterium wieringae TaxID=52694 RepID=A0A5D0WWF5_9FIRM|nr:type II toxin-antitoxin system HicB family antitoxin [Acetobacterium wieringae]TYC88058.1 type II toxin-antitoxin system HicB family antitoxin [Acetobacterium wieringae]